MILHYQKISQHYSTNIERHSKTTPTPFPNQANNINLGGEKFLHPALPWQPNAYYTHCQAHNLSIVLQLHIDVGGWASKQRLSIFAGRFHLPANNLPPSSACTQRKNSCWLGGPHHRCHKQMLKGTSANVRRLRTSNSIKRCLIELIEQVAIA